MVLFVSYSGAAGGAERLLIDFAAAVEVSCGVACPEGWLPEAAKGAGMEVFPLSERRPNIRATMRDRLSATSRLIAYGREVRSLVDELGPDLVVAWGMRPAIVCLLGPKLPCRVAFQQNDLLPGPAIGRLVRVAAGRADLVTAPSTAVARQLDPAGAFGSRLVVIAPGVDIGRFANDRPPARPPEVVVVGAVTRRKRTDLALEVCALARREMPELRLRVVGAPFDHDGDGLLRTLQARARRPDLEGAVEFAGAVEDPREDLARASCLLQCAEHEAFGLAILEALASGRPVVVPAAAGPAEIVDASCGVLYPPGDTRAAANAVVEIVANPQRSAEMGRAARTRARTHFDKPASQARYAAALAAVLAR